MMIIVTNSWWPEVSLWQALARREVDTIERFGGQCTQRNEIWRKGRLASGFPGSQWKGGSTKCQNELENPGREREFTLEPGSERKLAPQTREQGMAREEGSVLNCIVPG